jgi:hypothetical protein
MDPGIHSPMVDFFRRGEVARDARLLAAQGALATHALDQLALLVLLQDDPDPEIGASARETIARLPDEPLRAFLARPEVSQEMRAFFAGRGIAPAEGPAGNAVEPLLDDGSGDAPAVEGQGSAADNAALISTLPIMERLKLASKGTREQRAVLIRDPNKLIAVAVLSSPKLTDAEVEGFARMGNVSDEVLRIIGNNRAWTKNYSVVAALVRNPKTPPAISMRMLTRLTERDIKMVAIDRNVPEALRMLARKAMVKSSNR